MIVPALLLLLSAASPAWACSYGTPPFDVVFGGVAPRGIVVVAYDRASLRLSTARFRSGSGEFTPGRLVRTLPSAVPYGRIALFRVPDDAKGDLTLEIWGRRWIPRSDGDALRGPIREDDEMGWTIAPIRIRAPLGASTVGEMSWEIPPERWENCDTGAVRLQLALDGGEPQLYRVRMRERGRLRMWGYLPSLRANDERLMLRFGTRDVTEWSTLGPPLPGQEVELRAVGTDGRLGTPLTFTAPDLVVPEGKRWFFEHDFR